MSEQTNSKPTGAHEPPSDAPLEIAPEFLQTFPAIGDATSSCPACKAPMSRDAQVCIPCGYDRRIGFRFNKRRDAQDKARDGARAVDDRATCPRCGYDLRGLKTTTCPECGESETGRGSELRRAARNRKQELQLLTTPLIVLGISLLLLISPFYLAYQSGFLGPALVSYSGELVGGATGYMLITAFLGRFPHTMLQTLVRVAAVLCGSSVVYIALSVAIPGLLAFLLVIILSVPLLIWLLDVEWLDGFLTALALNIGRILGGIVAAFIF